ncbi:hypothetical protein FCK90_00010 [Kocuria coralli]|uniref:Uncharacterized protein n=1 Tax=Kocuria coralli TaxID=1461025 RepID=A0A5J5L1K8_9MICC|nr:hypothetical protein [Kocuria coralli]KAA9395458.1 hypothetical protein FCK90_00010 [Kocuria coralli]
MEVVDMASAPQIAPGPPAAETLLPRLSHRDYQSFWTTEEPIGWMDRVIDQAATWLRDRLDLDFDLSVDDDVSSPDRSKRAQTLHRVAGRDHGMRLRAWNTNNGVTFIVTILAVETPRGGWLQITVTCNDSRKIVKKPAFANLFLEVVDFDDVAPLRPEASYTSASDLDSIESLIDAPNRRLPVIIAAPINGASFDRWNTYVNKWTKQTVGIAHVVSLDPLAADEFKSRHGDRAVQSGTLRTYPPGIDISDPVTGKTARWLGHQSLAGNDKDIEQTIESFVRQHAAAQPLPLPSTTKEWSRAFTRIANGKLRESVAPAISSLNSIREQHANRQRDPATEKHSTVDPYESDSPDRLPLPPRTDPSTPHKDSTSEISLLQGKLADSQTALSMAEHKLRVVRETLMLDDLSKNSLLELVDAATRTIPDQNAIDTLLDTTDSLQARIESLEDDALNEEIQKVDARHELGRLEALYSRATREITYLRSKVAETDPEAAYSFTDQDAPENPLGECPVTWEQLVACKDLLQHQIVITANTKRLRELASMDVDGSALSAAWEAFGTLASYREAILAGNWESDIHEFCESGPLGNYRVPPNKHSRGETGATKQDSRCKKARLLPVPTTVDKSGAVYMWAHFKPYSWTAERKLRIHYHDQVTSDGSIYVGHIGEHLPSASTTKIHR